MYMNSQSVSQWVFFRLIPISQTLSEQAKQSNVCTLNVVVCLYFPLTHTSPMPQSVRPSISSIHNLHLLLPHIGGYRSLRRKSRLAPRKEWRIEVCQEKEEESSCLLLFLPWMAWTERERPLRLLKTSYIWNCTVHYAYVRSTVLKIAVQTWMARKVQFLSHNFEPFPWKLHSLCYCTIFLSVMK